MGYYKNVLRPVIISILFSIVPTVLYVVGASAHYPEWFNGLVGIVIGVFSLIFGLLINLKILEDQTENMLGKTKIYKNLLCGECGCHLISHPYCPNCYPTTSKSGKKKEI